jgi:hypothetical protein
VHEVFFLLAFFSLILLAISLGQLILKDSHLGIEFFSKLLSSPLGLLKLLILELKFVGHFFAVIRFMTSMLILKLNYGLMHGLYLSVFGYDSRGLGTYFFSKLRNSDVVLFADSCNNIDL